MPHNFGLVHFASSSWIRMSYRRRQWKFADFVFLFYSHTSQLHEAFTKSQLEQQQHSSTSSTGCLGVSRLFFETPKVYKMNPPPSPYECDDPSYHDPTSLDLQITPHSKSTPVTISYPKEHRRYELPRDLPQVLRNGNALPGLAKLPRKDILDYIPVHYERMPKPSNTRSTRTDPTRLGQTLPPVTGPRTPPRKDLGFEIVPDEVPPRQNKRAQNQWLWQRSELKEEVRRMKKVAQHMVKEDVRKREESSWPSHRKARRDSVLSVAVPLCEAQA